MLQQLITLELNADILASIKKEEEKAWSAFSCLSKENLDTNILEKVVWNFEDSYKK